MEFLKMLSRERQYTPDPRPGEPGGVSATAGDSFPGKEMLDVRCRWVRGEGRGVLEPRTLAGDMDLIMDTKPGFTPLSPPTPPSLLPFLPCLMLRRKWFGVQWT